VNASRVAQVSVVFWILKILSTGMGETAADYLDHAYSPILIVAISGVILLAALIWQLRAATYSGVRYWFAIVMVSVFGTLAADAVHVGFGIPYWASAEAFAIALMIIFWLWNRAYPKPTMNGITTRHQEYYYWCAVMASFALGTAAGDWMAAPESLGGLGYGFLMGAGIYTVGFLLPLVLAWSGRIPTVIAFWVSYTLTRPMGASWADWLALPPERGGLGFGTLNVTAIWVALFVVVLIVAGVRGRKTASA
jgi:uncharacterized membrane-anchored protein